MFKHSDPIAVKPGDWVRIHVVQRTARTLRIRPEFLERKISQSDRVELKHYGQKLR